MDDDGGDVPFDQDVEDLARRLFRGDAAVGAFPWGLPLLSSKARSNFFKSWDEEADATRRRYRNQARQVIEARHARARGDESR